VTEKKYGGRPRWVLRYEGQELDLIVGRRRNEGFGKEQNVNMKGSVSQSVNEYERESKLSFLAQIFSL